jgi:hypothetical protein
MKKRILIAILLTLWIQSINSQEKNTFKNDTLIITLDCRAKELNYDVLFVVSLGDKSFQKFTDFEKFQIDYNILSNQIESINVLKSRNETIEKYGENSKNGVIIISLKLSSLDNFNEKLKTEFMKIND